jgi:hypothetical protein
MVAIVDSAGNILHASNPLCSKLKCSVETVVGRSLTEFLPAHRPINQVTAVEHATITVGGEIWRTHHVRVGGQVAFWAEVVA